MNAIKLHHLKRKIINAIALLFATLFTLIAFIGLAWVLYTLISQGLAGLTWTTISQNTSAPGGGGGLLNVIVGSLLISLTALLIGSPIGILTENNTRNACKQINAYSQGAAHPIGRDF